MCSITETARTLDRASLEALGAAAHAEWLLGLRLILGGLHDPVLVLFLLLCQNLDVSSRHAFLLRWLSELFNIFVGEGERLLTTYQKLFHAR